MKRILLAVLVIIKNATIVIPVLEGMINTLVDLIEKDNKKVKDETTHSA